uniref:Uncharacterized protein n=1 Tax=viral metagenome TaxID=1070528 RepID=A0A6C0KXT6_9ZZZZ
MNIFFLHTNPRRCARWHCDKHVVKMLLETCQLLYTCHHMLGSDLASMGAPVVASSGSRGYRKSHMNHPCSKWLRTSLTSYRWLAELGVELLREYKFRYEDREHACGPHIQWLYSNYPPLLLDNGWIEPFLAMPDQYKCGDSVASYRRYYSGAKRDKGILIYTRRGVPHWLR